MLNNIKSNYFLNRIFDNILKIGYLKLIRYNKNLQKKLSISIENYIEYYYQTEIEIIPTEIMDEENENKQLFINLNEDKSLYHIFINDDREELRRNFLWTNEKVSKIKIFIDNKTEIKSELFKNCSCIKEIKFIKFNRTNITDMSYMFHNCKSLINLDISNSFNAEQD